MTGSVHPTAVVEPGARLGPEVEVGPLAYVAGNVELGRGSVLLAQATVLGPTRIGSRCLIHPHAVIGGAPQDRSYRGEPTSLEVGDDCVFREQVTVHRGTLKGGGTTRIGSRCLLMAGAHVAHDCQLGDDVLLTNLTTLGGHVRVENNVVCGGQVAVAPFVLLGRGCFVAGGAMVERDVPPFVIAAGDRARVRALNRVGLERTGVPSASRLALRRAFRTIWMSSERFAVGLAQADERYGSDPYVRQLVEFVRERTPD
jgi:UDP-N-acetylglucosamine acyltransferase